MQLISEIATDLTALQQGDRFWFWLCPSLPSDESPLRVSSLRSDPGRERLEELVAWADVAPDAATFRGLGSVLEGGRMTFGAPSLGLDELQLLADWVDENLYEEPRLSSLSDASFFDVSPDGQIRDEARDPELWAIPAVPEEADRETISPEEWEEIKRESQQAYITVTTVIDKRSTDWGEIDDLRKRAVQAKREGDLVKSVGFFRSLIGKARSLVKGASQGPTLQDWDAAKRDAQAAWARLSKVSERGDPSYEVIDAKRRAAVELRKRGHLASSIELFREIVDNVETVISRLESAP